MIAIGAGLGLLAYSVAQASQGQDEAGQGVSWLDQTLTYADPNQYLSSGLSGYQEAANCKAFLDMIAYSEGTDSRGGYRCIFNDAAGPNLFYDFSDHPRIAKRFRSATGAMLWTTAAGRYQFMAVSPLPNGATTKVDTWDRIKAKLGLPDFSPANQDAAALELIDEAGGLAYVRAGKFDEAVSKVRGIWASLPGAGYGQPEQKLASLRNIYQQRGGYVAA